MYLKSIDLYGFKSFAQKMEFRFDEGITAIVGPNGSGKSNVADAVRWVLGEQSAKNLRGAKMQDVIFAGTETRKPLGYCQVELTIDNHDMKMPIEFQEVKISRRVYRSGESEYLINGTECRLKDIHELFMDTGVGKEGYSIIGQGQIDKILSTKPDDRRELFDEATGIVKFKKRKQIAQKNLEEEKQNLLRINDIVRELALQQDALQEQAIKAKKYLDLKEALKKLEVNVFIAEYEKLQKNIDEIKDKEQINYLQVEELKRNSEQIKIEYEELNNSIEELDNKISEKKEAYTKLAVEKEKNESGLVLIREQISNIINNTERIKQYLIQLEEKQGKIKSEQKDYKQKFDSVNKLTEEKEKQLLEKQNELDAFTEDIIKDEMQIELIQTNRIERLNEISNVKTKIQRFHTMLENLQARKTSVNEKKELIERANKDRIDRIDRIENKKKNAEDDLKALLAEKEKANIDIQNKNSQIKDLNTNIKEKSEQYNTLRSKHRALTEMAEHYEGYGFSIKKIMELKKEDNPRYKGIIGVVADIIKVDKEYEIAMEIALGGSVQHLVTEDEGTAKRLIEYLKTNRFGRATFLPMTSIKNRDFSKTLNKKEPGFIGYASELLSYESKYSNIIEHLVGRVVVTDNIDNALAIAKKYNYTLKIVTLAGELIHPGGSLTGGANKSNNTHLLSRKSDIDNYETQMLEQAKVLNKFKKDLEMLEELYNNENKKLELIVAKEHELNIILSETNVKLKEIEKETNQYIAEAEDIETEIIQLNYQEEQLAASHKEQSVLLEGSEIENTSDEEFVKRLTDEIQSKKLFKEQLSETLTLLKVEVSSLKQQQENVKNNESRMLQELSELQGLFEKNQMEIQINNSSIAEKEKSVISIIEQIKEKEEGLIRISKQTEELNKTKHDLSENQQRLYKIREEYTEQKNLVEKEIVRLQASKEKLEMQNDAQIEYMWNEYELTIHQSEEYKDDSLGSQSALKKLIAENKSSIKNLGDVNVNAIEEFKAVSERYTFLMEQKEDLIKAEEMLKGVIEDLHEQMTKQFNEKFKEISLKFNDVFRELFGGGKAILSLTEESDILECGIELIAQPPGKKLQSMNLLSGGEKAFTAIALLFAIQSLKPSPFCVLDEIEAALDDSNVSRFANYLHKLTKNTQFIIITHRRGTMEVADSLYGITMQEKGVSTQVSVKIMDFE